MHCVTLSPSELLNTSHEPLLRNASIVAGHFFWGVWEQLPRWVAANSGKNVGNKEAHTSSASSSSSSSSSSGIGGGGGVIFGADSANASFSLSRPPPCLVMGRHPIDRAISYYYQRCYQISDCIGYKRRINELKVSELKFIADHERQGKLKRDNVTIVILDEGMGDAACRTLAGEKATSGLVVDPQFPVSLPPPLSAEAASRALRNVDHCVVGLLERWSETKQVLSAWFPWLGDFSNNPERRKMFLFDSKESWSSLRPEMLAVLLNVNKCDLLLYEKMKTIFEKELEVINDTNFLASSSS